MKRIITTLMTIATGLTAYTVEPQIIGTISDKATGIQDLKGNPIVATASSSAQLVLAGDKESYLVHLSIPLNNLGMEEVGLVCKDTKDGGIAITGAMNKEKGPTKVELNSYTTDGGLQIVLIKGDTKQTLTIPDQGVRQQMVTQRNKASGELKSNFAIMLDMKTKSTASLGPAPAGNTSGT